MPYGIHAPAAALPQARILGAGRHGRYGGGALAAKPDGPWRPKVRLMRYLRICRILPPRA